ncbi:hypothetical protein [Asanoa siamensis]|uniref:Uncharacterized protein n=1 Tax=Asanoa siamensis TaxID=926357 RepID=A0ABQ4CI41_9ACTN|nr:hypothetical protein [Asanoa siamensis]GIF70959.1 hypothetical protein Asi02nite_04770 [Asanoa siamensis]
MSDVRRFRVVDDSGLIALVDHHAYHGYVSPEWTYETLFARFRDAMGERQLLIWGTGREEDWIVDVVVGGPAPADCFRRAVGPIRVTSGQLHVLSYDSLSMAAQFDDVRLPEPHRSRQVFDLAPGLYSCDVAQLEDPDYEATREPHFVLTLTANYNAEPWQDPPWHEA